MAPTASWEAKALGLDKVLSRGRQGDFDSLVSLCTNSLSEVGKAMQR